MKPFTAIATCVLLALVGAAHAQSDTTFDVDGVHLDFPNWLRIDPMPGPMEPVLQIAPVDLSGQPFRTCSLTRAPVQYEPGTTQRDVNARLSASVGSYATSPTYSRMGQVVSAVATEAGAAVTADVVVLGDGQRGPSWLHDRTFALLRADGTAHLYRLSCGARDTLSDAQIAEMNAILASLRVAPESPP